MNLSVLLDMAADAFADRVLIGSSESGLTAGELRAMSIAAAGRIRAAGADALVYLGVNGPAFPIALFAAARAGVPLVPMNYRLGDEQLQPLLAKHPRALILCDQAEVQRLGAAGIQRVPLEGWLGDLAASSSDGDGEIPETDSPAAVIYTSGTTSTPKGVLIRHSNLLSYIFNSVEFGSAHPDDAALISLPPYHIAAVANALTNIYAGRRTVVLEQFTPDQWVSTVRTESITNALIVPTMLARIVSADVELAAPSLRTLAYGGAPMPVSIVTKAMGVWPHVEFVNAYGLTETSSTIAVLGPEDHRAALASDDPSVRARLGSAGKVLPSIELEIRDELGAVLPVGATGRIWVRGDQVSGEYTGMGKSTDPDGWFDTRDEGHLDDEGFLFIGGRTDDTIIRGAENIAPAEIEVVLLALDGVEDAVVVGVPDPEWGQRIEAAVVLTAESGLTVTELRDHVRAHLRSSKTPDRIEIWDKLPRTETGKILRRTALQRLLDHSSASVTT